jgi:hypothetical protein
MCPVKQIVINLKTANKKPSRASAREGINIYFIHAE